MTGLPTTTDAFYHGQVIIKQLKKGYRFAVDSPILAESPPLCAGPRGERRRGVHAVSGGAGG